MATALLGVFYYYHLRVPETLQEGEDVFQLLDVSTVYVPAHVHMHMCLCLGRLPCIHVWYMPGRSAVYLPQEDDSENSLHATESRRSFLCHVHIVQIVFT